MTHVPDAKCRRQSKDMSPIDTTATQHDGTEHLAINNTIFRRFCTLLAIKTTGKLYTRNGGCIPISKRLIVKTGYWAHLTEAATMKFVKENTSLPVPSIYCSFVHKKRAYIVMERIQGDVLAKAWPKLSEESLEKIFADLKCIVLELRLLKPPPGTGVQSCSGTSLHDCRIPRSCPRFGPFKTIQEFHSWLRGDLQASSLDYKPDDQHWNDIRSMVSKQDGLYPPPVFTHCDLHPFNIIIRKDEIVGIIDWEFSGWYPHYWEYTSAWFGNQVQPTWQEMLPRFLEPFPVEFEMEKIRHKWWGEW